MTSEKQAFPLEYPKDIPSGLVPSTCTGCGKLWWIEPPPVDVGHCMCCMAKLKFLIAQIPPEQEPCSVCGRTFPHVWPCDSPENAR